MYFKSVVRTNPRTGKLDSYYRLIESYRNTENRVCHRTILNVGFLEGIEPEQLNKVQKLLTDRYHQRHSIFEEEDPIILKMVEELWSRIAEDKKIDLEWAEKEKRKVDIDTIQHSNVREVGAEWISYNAWDKLQLTSFFREQGWDEEQIQLAATQVVSRAVYPESELRTSKWIKENSGICELTGYDTDQITKDKLYNNSLKLYEIKDKIEKHLSITTNTLFDLEDKIILYDLTNTYFEGSKVKSKIAKHGRSKEKRKDAKLIVLAMVVNIEGFIKYSAIHQGNIADCKKLITMITKIKVHTCSQKAVIVLDAGIATEENLKLIEENGYHYVCVSRTQLKEYEPLKNRLTVILETKTKNEIQLKAIATIKNTDYYLEVKSNAKSLKEQGMKNLFEKLFEEELEKISNAINRKGGIKQSSKVYERLGRIKQKYPTANQYFDISVKINEQTNQVTELIWQKNSSKHDHTIEHLGIYFLRTNLNVRDEVIIWNIYNTIREIESTFRVLKNDLNLRPIYHKNDNSTMAHLHLGILAYWLVNTIRFQLKAQNIKHSWTEIVRIANTQKIITTTGQNTEESIISIRKCSEPSNKLKELMDVLKINYKPFRKRKSVVHKMTPNFLNSTENQLFISG